MRPKHAKYQVGELLTLNRFLPPILSGSTVAVKEVVTAAQDYRYRVESTEYPVERPVWAYEDDLVRPLEMT